MNGASLLNTLGWIVLLLALAFFFELSLGHLRKKDNEAIGFSVVEALLPSVLCTIGFLLVDNQFLNQLWWTGLFASPVALLFLFPIYWLRKKFSK